MFKKGVYISKADWITSRLHFDEAEKQKEELFYHILYRAESGRIGFDADSDGEAILRWLFTDAWAWNRKDQRTEKFIEIREEAESQDVFLSRLGGPPRTSALYITYHQPNKCLKKLFTKAEAYYARKVQQENDWEVPLSWLPLLVQLPQIKLEAACLGLTNLVNECEMIAVWLIAQLEAILLLKDFSSFQARLQEACHKRGLELFVVESSDQLPEW